ncbi:MmgE/PrpD family protein [Streptomyces sp. NPDC048182]|uniref:MmgE/PrpD family protein n=1 Tax=Streptomyces sp. NPDC048182 TaxID=3365507 RepID=UPI0037202FA2
MTLTEELAEWAHALRFEDIPRDVVEIAGLQLLSQCAAMRTGAAHPLGRRLVAGFGQPTQPDPRRAAFVLAGLGSWLHFDDTAFAGHLSNSTVAVPMAYARSQKLDGRALLTSVIVANECAARITASATLGPFRGQSATFAHVVGAVAGRLAGEDVPVRRWVDALGLGLGLPPRTVPIGFLGGDAKVFSASTPVAVGLDACDAAGAGFTGSAEILEHPEGFLSRFSTVPLPEAVTLGLGRRWHTRTMSFKVHPGGPGMDAAIDCGLELHRAVGPVRAADVAGITVDTSLYTAIVNAQAGAYVRGPQSPVSALVFALPYLLATVLLTGDLTIEDFSAAGTGRPERWRLAELVRVRLDDEMTYDLFHSEVPFGEALRLAGPRAAEWLRPFGARWKGDGQWLVDLVGEVEPPSEDFRSARKVTGARVTVGFRDGRSVSREVDVPVGAVGATGGRPVADLVREKFLGTGGSAATADAMTALEPASAAEVAALLEDALDRTAG